MLHSRDLVALLGKVQLLNSTEVEFTHLTQDHRQVRLGSLFVAVKGAKFDGHRFLSEALTQGALGLVVENEKSVPVNFRGPVFVVESTAEILPMLAEAFYRSPSMKLFTLGVTGTNGKTSITYLLEHLLASLDCPTGVLGTIDHHLQEKSWPASHTTPSATLLQERLYEMKSLGAKAVALEVSSHALDQGRTKGLHFDTVIFTNLTRDHLDYHKSMEAYFAAKEKLFLEALWASRKMFKTAVVNTDDDWGARLRVADSTRIWTYGQRPECDFCISEVQSQAQGTRFQVKTFMGTHQVEVPLWGLHNVYNSVAALAAAHSSGLPFAQLVNALKNFKGVPGRLQRVSESGGREGPLVFVDYAHTPDALEHALKTLRTILQDRSNNGKLSVVFGCGGDRDPGKRPLMGAVAAKLADRIYLTSDNPRSEDPREILHQIAKGIPEQSSYHLEVDRERSIAFALDQAGEQDVVLISGKGHEKEQIIQQNVLPFDDVLVAQKYLQNKSR